MEIAIIAFIIILFIGLWLLADPVQPYRGSKPPDEPPGYTYTRTKKTKRK